MNKLEAVEGHLQKGQPVLPWREGLLEEAVRRAPRGGRVLVRDVGISGGLTRLDLQDRVAVAPVEALQNDVGPRLSNPQPRTSENKVNSHCRARTRAQTPARKSMP